MRHARVFAVSAVIAVPLLLAVTIAQTSVSALPDHEQVAVAPLDAAAAGPTTWGDPQAGQAKAAACVACHGIDGNAAIDMYPRIAGQNEHYSAAQMALIANGQRGGMAVAMVPFVQDLSAQDMRDIGAWFASQKAAAGLADDSVIADGASAGMKFYEVGQQLYRGGDSARGIPACQACHGPTGAGNPGPGWPHIGGQHAAYLSQRLEQYRSGEHTLNDPAQFKIMAQIAGKLSDHEIQSLASYLQGLHPRSDDAATAPAMTASRAP